MQLSCEDWFNDLITQLPKKNIQYNRFCFELENFDSNDFNLCNNHSSHHKKYYEKIILFLWLKSQFRGKKWNRIEKEFKKWEATEKIGLDFINNNEQTGIQIKTLRNNIYYRQDRKIAKAAINNTQEAAKIIKANVSKWTQPLKNRSKIVSTYVQGFLNIMGNIKYSNLSESIENMLIIYVPQFISNPGFDLFNLEKTKNLPKNKTLPDFAVRTKREFFELCSFICSAGNNSQKSCFKEINILYFQENKVYSENLFKPIYQKKSVIRKWGGVLITKSHQVSDPIKYSEKLIKHQLKKQAI